jgi:sulfite reductase (ferredoxin)
MAVEAIKADSGYLRGAIGDELGSAGEFGAESTVLLKFHGIYQQDDRDIRRSRAEQKLPLDYSCMVRTSVPGGVISLDQWLALDRLAELADGSMRLTTRQGVQYHFVPKGQLHEVVRDINASLLTTLAACGDVVRNVMACPLPHADRRAVLAPVVAELVRRFRPRTPSYWELWVDGERAATVEAPPPDGPVEPLYGETYLPRKFKIGIAWPGDNCVDIHSHDVGIVPTLSGGVAGDLTGFVVLAGGGMGMSHSRPDDTYPVLGRPVAWVPPEDLADVVEAIVATQRDFGDRDDRHRARLKYTLEEHGIDWLRTEIETRTGRAVAEPIDLPPWKLEAHHGWDRAGQAGDDRNGDVLGIPVPSGRVAGNYRDAIRAIAQSGLVSQIRVTPRQDLLLCGIRDRESVLAVLRRHSVALPDDVSPLRRLAIACPALPTCGQALGEAERVLPTVIDELEKLLADTGNEGQAIRLNMTGCPNGCARPYSAEIGIVGRTKKTYDLYLGGSAAGDRLAQRVRADIPLDEITAHLRPLLERFAADGVDDDALHFGDWCFAQGATTLETWLPAPTMRRRARGAASDGIAVAS